MPFVLVYFRIIFKKCHILNGSFEPDLERPHSPIKETRFRRLSVSPSAIDFTKLPFRPKTFLVNFHPQILNILPPKDNMCKFIRVL
jgi:hypothetical protein